MRKKSLPKILKSSQDYGDSDDTTKNKKYLIENSSQKIKKIMNFPRSSFDDLKLEVRNKLERSRIPDRTEISFFYKYNFDSLKYNLCKMPKKHPQKVSLSVSSPILPKEKSTKSSNCLFTQIQPLNVEQEKLKFIQSNFSYNPQFQYESTLNENKLEKFNSSSDQYLPQAIAILKEVLRRYGNYKNFEEITAGKTLKKQTVESIIKKYLKKEGFYGNVVVNLNENLISRGSMTLADGRPTLNIKPSTAKSLWLDGLLRHEIGTHHIRFHNNRQQIWSNKKVRRNLRLKKSNPTEEGLASLHSVLLRRDPSLWRSAFLYYTAHKSTSKSFCDLFHDLGRFVRDVDVRWDYCLRTKRGRHDTSLPGGFCKDQVYLTGIIELLQRRHHLDFQNLCRLGKVSYEDVDRLLPLLNFKSTKLPTFMEDSNTYQFHLDRIVKMNGLSHWLDLDLSPERVLLSDEEKNVSKH